VHKSIEPDQTAPSMVIPLLPLAILEALRAQDRPAEVLEDEDVVASLPRRFGLTGVVASQIERYREAARKGRPIPADDVADLFRLVLRRPDAREILHEAGRQAARQYFERIPRPAASALGVLPRRAAQAAARRGAQKMLRRLHHPGRCDLLRNPWRALLFEPLTRGLDTMGIACTFYGAAIEECFYLYTRQRPQIIHSLCSTLGGEHCEWTLEP
jgi:hypothetical protein